MTKRRYSRTSIVLSVGALLAFAGCGGKTGTVKVQGVATLDGQPLGGATVTFISPQGGRPASGVTAVDGSFHLTTYNDGDGALPGEYRVVVTRKSVAIADAGPGAADADADPGEKGMAKMGRHGDRKGLLETGAGKRKILDEQKKLPPSAVPAIYSDQKTTPLTQVVPPPGPVKLELSSKPQ